MGYLKGNAVKITKNQFPDIYTIVKDYSEKLSFKNIPEVYVLEGGGLLNAFATRLAGRNFVVIYSDVLEVAYAQGKDAVSFIIGHELGHIKQNHLGLLKSFLILPASLYLY